MQCCTDYGGCTLDSGVTIAVDIEDWDTSLITDMARLFAFSLNPFNGNITRWNTSQVTDMSNMFTGCYGFNQPLGWWDTSKVTNMKEMFSYTRMNQVFLLTQLRATFLHFLSKFLIVSY